MRLHPRDFELGVHPATPLARLTGPQRRFVEALRQWLSGPDARAGVWNGFAGELGAAEGRAALAAFEDYLAAVAEGAARRLMRGAPGDPDACADECALARALSDGRAPDFIQPHARPEVAAAARRLGRALAPRSVSDGCAIDAAELGFGFWRGLTGAG